MLKIDSILINYLENPPYVVDQPNIGWKMYSDSENVFQVSYQLRIENSHTGKCVFDTGIVFSDESAHIVPDCTFENLSNYSVFVKVNSNIGESAEAKTSFTTGTADNSIWKGIFISPETEDERDLSDTSLIRKDVNIRAGVESAFISCTAGGLYELYINGNKVSDDFFTPGWTSYNKRLQYQVYDISEYLADDSTNTFGVILGAGWYKGKMSYNLNRNHYGKITCFAAYISIKYTDGSTQIITTDSTWKHAKGPVLFSEIYDGETCDLRLSQTGWDCPDFDDNKWSDSNSIDYDESIITYQDAPSVKIMNIIKPIAILTTSQGDTVVDFGQNLTGWCRLTIDNTSIGDEIIIKYFETLDDNGNVYLDNLRTAKQTITITSNGGAIDYRPHFTFQGFRYAWIVKWPGKPNIDNFTACALHTAMPETGSFRCADELVNGLQHNILWSMKGNSLDVPTDCPQRDERLGWTGDVQIFNSTAMFLMNAYGFYSKWLKDIEADQYDDGSVPHIVPDIVSGKSDEDWLTSQGCSGASAWADAAIVVPWNLFLTYGDTNIIKRQYESMKKWIAFMQSHSERGCLFSYKLQFGDWVALDAEEGSYFGATPTAFTCAAYYCYVVRLFSKMAKAIGNIEDANTYSKLADDLKTSFINEFIKDKHLTVNTQTAQIVALFFNLVPDDCIETIAADLKKLLDDNNGHLVTGFIGTPYFCHALSENGYADDAYDLLLKDDFPSWLYQVKRGATTVWEHWDGLKPDGTMWSADMNSFNHYAYGAIGDWLYKAVCGLKQDENAPGYKHFFVCPHPNDKLGSASLSFDSIYGNISISWTADKTDATVNVTVPVNTKATFIPDGYTTDLESPELLPGTHVIHCKLQ